LIYLLQCPDNKSTLVIAKAHRIYQRNYYMDRQKQVLIVDDEAAIRDLVSDLLTNEGYSVNTAAHAGLAAVRAQYVDCVILDLQLSAGFQMEGGSILTHLWEDEWCNVPVIIFSGLLDVSGIEDSLLQIEQVCGKGRNIYRCVPKSQGPQPLIDAVNECLKPSNPVVNPSLQSKTSSPI